jgi:multidrug efflux system outer membrane protein
MLSNIRIIALAKAGCVVAGCSTPVPQVLKPAEVPPAFTGPVAPGASLWPNPDWWKAFGSDEMSGLVATAQTDNLDIALAMANVLQAKANREIARSALFPTIDAEPSAQRTRTPGEKVGLLRPASSVLSRMAAGFRTSGAWHATICAPRRKH